MRKHFVSLLSIFMLTLLLSFQNCAQYNGTETGNLNLPVAGSNLDANSLLDTMCSKLSECNASVDFANCKTQMLNVTTVSPKIGLPANFGNFQSIINETASGAIKVNQTAADSCLIEISNLTCSNASVTAAYSSAAPANFTNTSNLIPADPSGNCANFF